MGKKTKYGGKKKYGGKEKDDAGGAVQLAPRVKPPSYLWTTV